MNIVLIVKQATLVEISYIDGYIRIAGSGECVSDKLTKIMLLIKDSSPWILCHDPI